MTLRPNKEPGDWELVESVRKGSADAFERLVTRYQRKIATIIYLSLGNAHDAEDLAQETFFRLFQAIPHLDPRENIFPWVYRTAVNLCIDESRKRSIRRIVSLDFLIDQGVSDSSLKDASQSADAGLLNEEKRARIQGALLHLPTDQRIVLLMRDFEDLTYKDISDILSISVASVKTKLFRARSRVRSILRRSE